MEKMSKNIPYLVLMTMIAVCLTWELWLAPLPTQSGIPWLAIKMVPLALAVQGFAADRLYTYKWMSLAVWLYFIEGTVRGWSDKGLGSQLAWAEALLAVLLFTACVLRIRQLRKL